MYTLINILIGWGILAILFAILNRAGTRRRNKARTEPYTLLTWHAPMVKWVGLVACGVFLTVCIYTLSTFGAGIPEIWALPAIPLVFFILGLAALAQGTLDGIAVSPQAIVQYSGFSKPRTIPLGSITKTEEKLAASGSRKLVVYTTLYSRPVIVRSTLEKYTQIRALLMRAK